MSCCPLIKSKSLVTRVVSGHQAQQPHAYCSPALLQPNTMLAHPPLHKPWAGLSHLWAFVPTDCSAYHHLPHPSLLTEVWSPLKAQLHGGPFCQRRVRLGLKFFVFLSFSAIEQREHRCVPPSAAGSVPAILGRPCKCAVGTPLLPFPVLSVLALALGLAPCAGLNLLW